MKRTSLAGLICAALGLLSFLAVHDGSHPTVSGSGEDSGPVSDSASSRSPRVRPAADSGSARSGETPVPAEGLNDSLKRARLRDLYSGEPLGHFTLELRGGAFVTSDVEGWCELSLVPDEALHATAPGHWVARTTALDPETGEPTLWLGREVEIVGRVVGRGRAPLEPELLSDAEAGVFFAADPRRPFGESGRRGELWWRKNRPRRETVAIADDGTFRLHALLPNEFAVYATGVDGHSSGVTRAPEHLPVDGPLRVEVVCEPQREISLDFTDLDGNPLAGVVVHVVTVAEVARSDAAGVNFHRPEGGYGYVAGAESVVFKWHAYGESRADGNSRVRVGSRHRAVVSAYQEGRELLQLHVPAGEDSVHRRVALAPLAASARLRVTLDGEPLASESILLNDMRDPVVSVTLPMSRTDADGYLRHHQLERGVRYMIGAAFLEGMPRTEFVWGGQREIALTRR